MLYGGGMMSLLTLVAGYWLLERSETHKGQLRSIGRILGAVIIVVSLLGVVCSLWTGCAMGKRGKFGGMCPLFSRPASPLPPAGP